MTYYVFSRQMHIWRNRTQIAKPSDRTLRYAGRIEDHWWDAVRVVPRPATALMFFVDARAPMLDNYFTGMEFDLYSSRLVQLMQDAGVQFESLPAALLDRKTRQVLPAQYEVFHLLEKCDVIDEDKSDMGDLSSVIEVTKLDRIKDAERIRDIFIKGLSVNRLVLKELSAKPESMLFRIERRENLVLIHDDLKTILEAAEITGCQYTRTDEFQISPLLGN